VIFPLDFPNSIDYREIRHQFRVLIDDGSSMAKSHRILNISRNFTLKYAQAERAISECACEWVDFGRTVRDLTLAESISARNTQAREREPIASPELPGLTFEMPQHACASIAERRQLVQAANQFAAQVI
jgi:hypothetical protein